MSHHEHATPMEENELFDRYVNDSLTRQERDAFDARLKDDGAFASRFKVYLFTVDGVCREARQDNLDLGIAMKHLTKEQLRGIIGSPPSAPVKPRRFRFTPRMWQVASVAAVAVVACTVIFHIERDARRAVDNAVYAASDIYIRPTRAGGEAPPEITEMTDEELQEQLPRLLTAYEDASDPVEIQDYGFALAMSYLRLHQRQKAVDILNQLVVRFEGDEDMADNVARWQSILEVLE